MFVLRLDGGRRWKNSPQDGGEDDGEILEHSGEEREEGKKKNERKKI